MKNAQEIRDSEPLTTVSDVDGFFDVTDATVTAVPAGDKIEVTVTEAAKLLDISKRTIWRRIRSGELACRSDGRQTFVTIPASLDVTTSRDKPASATTKVPRHSYVTEEEVTHLNAQLERTRAELTAASNRALYLQGQVDLYEQQFKLLTDSQHKHGLWQRFRSWILNK